jgi:hypothetical protein
MQTSTTGMRDRGCSAPHHLVQKRSFMRTGGASSSALARMPNVSRDTIRPGTSWPVDEKRMITWRVRGNSGAAGSALPSPARACFGALGSLSVPMKLSS